MKKQLILSLLLGLSFFSFKDANPDLKVLGSPDLIWAGLDFSEAKLIGSEGFTDPVDIKNRFFASWNNLIINESDKYNIKEFYKKNEVINDLSVVTKRNEVPDAEDIVTNDAYFFEEGKLESIIQSYQLEKSDEGLGLVYIVESFNKIDMVATISVVFFDVKSKEILWTQQYKEKPAGFGLRNFWAGAIYKVMKSSKSDYDKAIKKLK